MPKPRATNFTRVPRVSGRDTSSQAISCCLPRPLAQSRTGSRATGTQTSILTADQRLQLTALLATPQRVPLPTAVWLQHILEESLLKSTDLLHKNGRKWWKTWQDHTSLTRISHISNILRNWEVITNSFLLSIYLVGGTWGPLSRSHSRSRGHKRVTVWGPTFAGRARMSLRTPDPTVKCMGSQLTQRPADLHLAREQVTAQHLGYPDKVPGFRLQSRPAWLCARI